MYTYIYIFMLYTNMLYIYIYTYVCKCIHKHPRKPLKHLDPLHGPILTAIPGHSFELSISGAFSETLPKPSLNPGF